MSDQPDVGPLPDNTQHLQERDFQCPGRIRTRIANKEAAADPRLRPRGLWGRVL